ncbi:acyl-CoA synthetase [Burkholderia ubonensis]|uniref:acyl-CoA synthetase n=1 Tax=Burkholderia ubonensis TaxID=101571 RepID=UPI0009B5390F|nr:acyl-CoA synthetase [Burkholderia ubonensis]
MTRTIDDIEAIEQIPLDAVGLAGIDGNASTWSMLARSATRQPEAPALSFFARVEDYEAPVRWSYRQWLGEINRTARLFRRLGVQRGDVVAYVLPNLPETHLVIWGAETAGIAFGINPLLESAQIGKLLAAAQVRWVATTSRESDPEIWGRVEAAVASAPTVQGILAVDAMRYVPGRQASPLPASMTERTVLDFHGELARESDAVPDFPLPDAEDIASYFCTGGTTGLPKIACRTHRNEVANCLQLVAMVGDAALRRGSTILVALPLFHVYPAIGAGLAVFAQGGHVLLGPPAGFRTPGFIGRFWDVVERHGVTAFSGVPTVYAALLQVPHAGRDISSLTHAICGAAPMPVELFHAMERETGLRVLEAYGLTEGTCLASVNPVGGEARIGSVGLRAPWLAMRTMIVGDGGAFVRMAETEEIGAVCLSGPNVFRGYLDPEHNRGAWFDAPDVDGTVRRWFNTGDLGRMDADGYFWLTGRKKELIIRGGHNIDPRQIEEVFAGHPAVALCAALGRPDMHAGEVPVAYVQLRQGAAADASELLAYAQRHIGEHAAVPKAVIVVPTLPLTAVGKIFKPALHQREIADAVRAAAVQSGVELSYLSVEQDARRGVVARYRLAATGPATNTLADLLGRYVFNSEEVT